MSNDNKKKWLNCFRCASRTAHFFFSFLSSVVKNLLLKMLTPQPQLRLSITQVSEHAWIKSFRDVGNTAFTPIDDKLKRKIIEKTSADHKIPITEMCKQLDENPFGPIGGIFNVEKFLYQSTCANNQAIKPQSYIKSIREMKVRIIAFKTLRKNFQQIGYDRIYTNLHKITPNSLKTSLVITRRRMEIETFDQQQRQQNHHWDGGSLILVGLQ